MGLDNIELDLKICNQLFKNTLVAKAGKKPSNKTIEYEGANKKKILFIFRKSQDPSQSSAEVNLLSSICKACNLTMDDIALVNYISPAPDFSNLKNQFKFKYLLSFGVTPSDLSFPGDFKNFQIVNFKGAQCIFAPSLNDFLNNKSYKASLWKGMQQLFF